jgi:hypothetical protein
MVFYVWAGSPFSDNVPTWAPSGCAAEMEAQLLLDGEMAVIVRQPESIG